MKLLKIVASLFVIGFLASRCGSSSDHSSASTPPPAAPSREVIVTPAWHYDSWTDSMTGDSGSYASTTSENTANLEFPYQGEQHAELTVSDNGIVSLAVEKGQVTCSPGCYVLIKFDDEKAKSYGFSELGDKRIKIFSFEKALMKKIYAAKRMTARMAFFQNGSVDFDFRIGGLKPLHKAKKLK